MDNSRFMKLFLSAVILLVVVSLILFFFISGDLSLTGKAVEEEEGNVSKLKVCNIDNECIDIEVECKDGNLVDVYPIRNLSVLGEEWEEVNNNLSDYCTSGSLNIPTGFTVFEDSKIKLDFEEWFFALGLLFILILVVLVVRKFSRS